MSRYTAYQQRVVDACRQLADEGYLAGTGGNIALRVDADHFAVTPSAKDYYALRAEDICILSLATLQQVEGDLKPSVESGLHACLLRAKPGMAASVHTHQPRASAVALLNVDIPLIYPADRAALGDKVAIVPYAPSGTGLLVRALRKRLSPQLHAYLLRNHGVICAAAEMDQAIASVRYIEAAATAFLHEHASRATALPPELRSAVLGELAPTVP
ncbi:MAG: class II aldolase/adducin family protein [Burkholderiales bacterium]|nr:class II aldolase/adducin family protein [Burkholderiales bacterium]